MTTHLDEEVKAEGLSQEDVIGSYAYICDEIRQIVETALEDTKAYNLDEELSLERIGEEETRNVPLEPYAKAEYIIGRIRFDCQRYLACRKYNIDHGIDLSKQRIKHEHRITKREYYEVQKDYKYILGQLQGDLKKHQNVFENLIMKDMTLEEYGKQMKPNETSRQYLIKWAFNQKKSFTNALARCYTRDVSSMKYFDGIQKENSPIGRTLYMLEREIVSSALTEVDSGTIEYFEAMKNAYDKLYNEAKKLKKESLDEEK